MIKGTIDEIIRCSEQNTSKQKLAIENVISTVRCIILKFLIKTSETNHTSVDNQIHENASNTQNGNHNNTLRIFILHWESSRAENGEI